MIGNGTPTLEAAGGRSCGLWTAFDWKSGGQSIPDRVGDLARMHPDRQAAFDVDTRLTYGELERAANRLANHLLAERGHGPEAVMLMFDVGVAGIVAALGVLKAGKHFVAVEPTFSRERIAQIAENARAAVLLTDREMEPVARQLAGAIAAVACIDDLDASPEGNPEVATNLEDIAALSYTSGSTGRPKGVVQTHRSTVARVTRYATAYRLGAEDRFATFGSFAWSGSLSDVFGALCLGASAGAYDTRRYGLQALVSWLERNGITAFAGITIARRLAFDFPEHRFPEVRLIQLGGDTVYRRDVEALQSVFPNAVLAVGMGTTETGRIAEQFIAPGTLPAQEVVPIGFPAPGVRILILGEDGSEVEPGSVGEIVIQSRDNAVGYWNLPELTAEKFRRDPSLTEGSRYFSGDLGRLLPGGVLQHVGRKDFQVKIRGYQVLTNEVEAILFAVAGVRDVCVVAQAGAEGGEQLVAFLVRDLAGRLPGSDLQARLRARLPDYMVPQRFVDLDALPKTAAGKPDRRALPVVSATRGTLGALYVAPRTLLEDTIASIWRDVLAIDAVGVEDDFLGLGGDSLQAMRIVHRVQTAVDFDLTVGELLGGQTVARMAALIASRKAVGVESDATPPIRPRGGTRR